MCAPPAAQDVSCGSARVHERCTFEKEDCLPFIVNAKGADTVGRQGVMFTSLVMVLCWVASPPIAPIVLSPPFARSGSRPLLLNEDGPSVNARVQQAVSIWRDNTAYIFNVTPEYVDVGFGCVLYLLLNGLSRPLSLAIGIEAVTPRGDGPVPRLLTVAGFAAAQQIAGTGPVSSWLRLKADESRVSSSPTFQSGSPLAGVTFAFAFGLAVAVPAQVLGIEWVPAAREFPEAGRALHLLFVAPLCEEIFFRAWLLHALERAAPYTNPMASVLASSAVFALYQVPFADVLRDGGSTELLLFEALGAYLAFLYQRSGGSLPFVVVTHCTFNLLVTTLRAVQVGSALPF